MNREAVNEARMVETKAGRKPVDDGWFVVNAADAVAEGVDDEQYGVLFERKWGAFPHLGIDLRVVRPGRPTAFYHAESGQEAFLVLQGECTLIVEEQERTLRQWDFFHCPPHTAHVFVGAGERPCVILMVGARIAGQEIVYPISEVAARYGASSAVETTSPRVAYATLEARPSPGRFRWPPDA